MSPALELGISLLIFVFYFFGTFGLAMLIVVGLLKVFPEQDEPNTTV